MISSWLVGVHVSARMKQSEKLSLHWRDQTCNCVVHNQVFYRNSSINILPAGDLRKTKEISMFTNNTNRQMDVMLLCCPDMLTTKEVVTDSESDLSLCLLCKRENDVQYYSTLYLLIFFECLMFPFPYKLLCWWLI